MAPSEGMVHCRGCGKEIHSTATSCPHCGCVRTNTGFSGGCTATSDFTGTSGGGVTFGEAIKICLRKYAVFEGRATRPEFWYFYLFTFALNFGAAMLKLPESVSGLISLALFLPGLAATARRLHDMGRSGWNQLWTLTIIGIIPVIYWLTRPSDPAPNRYGPAPGTEFRIT